MWPRRVEGAPARTLLGLSVALRLALGGEIDQLERPAVGVECLEVGSQPGQVPVQFGFRFSRNASTPSWKSRLM